MSNSQLNDSLVLCFPQVEISHSTRVDWQLFDAQGLLINDGNSEINQIQAEISNHTDSPSVRVIVPADAVLLTSVSIPSSQLRQIRQALPFMVEELIADDIEDVHLALPAQLRRQDKKVDVAVVSHKLLISWLDVLHSNMLSPDQILVDVLCLPYEENAWTLLLDNDQVKIRTSVYSGLSVDITDIEFIFNQLVQQFKDTATQPVPKINIISSVNNNSDQAFSKNIATYISKKYPEFDLEEKIYQESLTEVVSASVSNSAPSINLLQGGYAVNTAASRMSVRWQMAAAIAGVSLVGYLLLTLASGWYFSYQAKNMELAATALYKELFPNERRIVSPKKQMQNHLRNANSSNNSSFLALLSDTSKQLSNKDSNLNLSVNQLRFDADRGDLQFEVKSDSLDKLDQLKQLLASAGLSAEINSATEQDQYVLGRIVVRNL